MELAEFARAFEAKTDGELLHLAAEAEQLTPEAKMALYAELTRRQLEIPLQEKLEDFSPAAESDASSSANPLLQASSGVAEFLAHVVRVYREHLWLFVRLLIPAVVLAYMTIFVAQNEQREVLRAYREPWTQSSAILEIATIGLFRFFVSWIGFCFSFAAICTALRQIERGVSPQLFDSFVEIRHRLGAFLRLSALLFAVYMILQTLATMILGWIVTTARDRYVVLDHRVVWLISLVVLGAVTLVVSRFGLAIPAFLWERSRVGQAMFRSDELTEGQWLKLASLLAKTVIGGYIAGMMPFWLAGWFLTGVPVPWWFERALTLTSIAAVSLIEPMLFIGFALLYEQTSARLPAVQQEMPG
jgi:hypothetical protein